MQEALNIQQRLKRANIAHRNKSKLERARIIAARKLAPESNIKKRAYALARKILRKKIAGGRGAEYQSLGPTEKEAIDKQLDSRKALIKKIAKRLMPKVKQAEQHRLQSFLKGAAMKNIDEAFEKKFADKKKKKKGETGFIKILDKFTEEAENNSKAYRALVRKADKYEVDLEVVAEIYNSAFEDYPETNTSLTEEQFAFARVNHELNELSKRTLGSYAQQAAHSLDKNSFKAGMYGGAKGDHHDKVATKRKNGLNRAIYKLANEETLDERNKENKFKKDLYVTQKGQKASRVWGVNHSDTADKAGHDHHIDYGSGDYDDDASSRHGMRKTAIRIYKKLGRRGMRNEEALQEEVLAKNGSVEIKVVKAKDKVTKKPTRHIEMHSPHAKKVRLISSVNSSWDHKDIANDLKSTHGRKLDGFKWMHEETLDELSKDTYNSYINASYKARNKEFLATANRAYTKKREKGIQRADRLLSKKVNEATMSPSKKHIAGKDYTLDKETNNWWVYKDKKNTPIAARPTATQAYKVGRNYKSTNEETLDEARFIVSGRHQDQGYPKTKVYQASSEEHARKQFHDEHDDFHAFKVKKLSLNKLTNEEHDKCGTPDCCGQCEPLDELLITGTLLAIRNRKKIKDGLDKINKLSTATKQRDQELKNEELGPENQIGTKALVKKLQKLTPGQEKAQVDEAVESQKEKIDKLNAKTRRQKASNERKLNPFKKKLDEATQPLLHYGVVMLHRANKEHKVIKFSEPHPTSLQNQTTGKWNLPHANAIHKEIHSNPKVKEHKASGWEVDHGVVSHQKAIVLGSVSKHIKDHSFRKFTLKEEIDLDEACWKGYKQLGMKRKGKRIVPNCVKEDVKSAEVKGVIVPSYIDAFGNTIPAKVVKRKVGNKILSTEDPHDGK